MNKRIKIAAAVLAVVGTAVTVPVAADAKGKPDRTTPSATVLGSYCSKLNNWVYETNATNRQCNSVVDGTEADPTFAYMGQVETYCESFPGWTLYVDHRPDQPSHYTTGVSSWNCQRI